MTSNVKIVLVSWLLPVALGPLRQRGQHRHRAARGRLLGASPERPVDRLES